MMFMRQLNKLLKSRKNKTRREAEVRQYAQDAIKTYKKTLRKLAQE